MKLIGRKILDQFLRKHPSARTATNLWIERVIEGNWTNHAQLKDDFPSADYVNGRYIFNIGGNKSRLVAVVAYKNGIIKVEWIGTHAEYDKMNFSK